MTSDGRIFFWHRSTVTADVAERLLEALDDRYPERQIVDAAAFADRHVLERVMQKLTADDLVLALVDPESESAHTDRPFGTGSAATCMSIGLGNLSTSAPSRSRGRSRQATSPTFELSDSTWGDDVGRLLSEIDLFFSSSEPTTAASAGQVDEQEQKFYEEGRRSKYLPPGLE